VFPYSLPTPENIVPPEPYDHSPLVQEVVDTLLSKFEKLPHTDRQVVIIASIEAIAWIAAMESASHCKKKGLNSEHAMERIEDYAVLFANNAIRDLAKSS
jgi:hypothetical protein